ncbi:DUF2778 domain-containing protein [Methylobacterium isbiliense]|jgi:hypothetical protein|uniref:Tlde1 domain-containing protein n=1 Tax=Methylobacterium isbiliense TaxID=315478 RepID=A0ABQ4SC85_9HYPH|nr:DUF2778 domain-containing protein [Methylobacterium isbiliense]MDN3621619.1 DUF2778 domain-containing protein [Methylobacterium isbiliense]GJE00737.1 hypothetical protein GMJLKIPL_2663 [Methylobacterium isbiliense]
MPESAYPSARPASRLRWPAPRRGLIRSLLALSGAVWLGWSNRDLLLPAAPPAPPVPQAAASAPAPAEPARHAWLFDPTPSMDPARLTWRREAPAPSRLAAAEPAPIPAPAPPAALAEAPAPLVLDARPVIQPVPLPVPRPTEFRLARGPETPRLALRLSPRRARAADSATAMADTRSFFEKLFGQPADPQPALAYASTGNGTLAESPRPAISPSPFLAGGTAVYDITARTVTLPSGERLEAHSGLGPKMDDPRFVQVRMHGATPPGIYDLTEREALFHGVRAIRLNPVGGPGAIHGRTGLLAHTYMLGPSGQSNGCVSFRDYNRFLQAFLRGEVRRLVVVAGRG